MSATDAPQAAGDKSYEEVRKAWHAAHIRPLWENPVAHKVRDGGPKAASVEMERAAPADRRRHEGHVAGGGRAARAAR